MTASLISLPPLVTADGRFVPDVLLTVRQAAALCGCHMITVRRRVEAGLLPGAHKRDAPGGRAPAGPASPPTAVDNRRSRRDAGQVVPIAIPGGRTSAKCPTQVEAS